LVASMFARQNVLIIAISIVRKSSVFPQATNGTIET